MSRNLKSFFISFIGAGLGYFVTIRVLFLHQWDVELGAENSVLSLPLSLLAGFVTFSLLKQFPLRKAIERTLISWFFCVFIVFGFSRMGIAIPLASLSNSFLWSTIGLIFFEAVFEKSQREFLLNAFKHYVSPQLVESIAAHPKKLGLQGEKRDISILFSDLEGFTKIAEKIEPDQLVQLMNEYFTGVTEIIFRYGGTIDKFIGDAVMAFWNAPMENAEHAQLCAECAFDLTEYSKNFVIQKSHDLPSNIRTRVGVNTGIAVVGNIGSKDRFSYTVMGDEINLASRLEGLNQFYKTQCLISGGTQQKILKPLRNAQPVAFRFVDTVKVKGRDKATDLFTLVLEDEVPALIEPEYRMAFRVYQKGNFKEAAEVFKKLANQFPQFGPSNALYERCQMLAQNPPAQWSGVFEFENK